MTIIQSFLSIGFILVLTGLCIYAIAAPTNQVSITEKLIVLPELIFFQILFWGSVLNISMPAWIPAIFLGIAILLFISKGRYGDWLGKLYNLIVKPYKSVYLKLVKALLILVVLGMIISAYLIYYLTWKGRMDPGVQTTFFAVSLMLIIGVITGSSGFCGSIWNKLMEDRSAGEKQIVIPLTISICWIAFIRYFKQYLKTTPAIIAGFLVLIYFVIAIRGYNKEEQRTKFLVPVYSFMHVVSLMGVITLILHSINA